MDGISADESSEVEVALPKGALDVRDPPLLSCYLYDHQIMGKCGIERQSEQPATSDEPISFCHLKRQWVACCICKQNSGYKFGFIWLQKLTHARGCLCKFSNPVGQRDAMRQQSHVEWIPFMVTPEGKKRKETRSVEWTCFCCPILQTALDIIFITSLIFSRFLFNMLLSFFHLQCFNKVKIYQFWKKKKMFF